MTQKNKPRIKEMADLFARQENKRPILYIAEMKINEARYINPMRAQSDQLKVAMGESSRTNTPTTKAIVVGTIKVTTPAKSLPNST